MLTKIAYLFGAGATHAEILNLEESPSETFRSKNGLLISDVSKRVMKMAQNIPGFKNNVELVTSTEGSLNIELLISLFESNRIPKSELKINKLKQLVEEDIIKRLSSTRKRKFYLHKALFELHTKIESREQLGGIISLNYDDILDEAYKLLLESDPNYCLKSKPGTNYPLLKLHGSFNWNKVNIYGKMKNIPIIPLGINKNYLIPPYNFIWSRAFEILVECDILRIIGCSLNQNDIGLIDLLFKAHLERVEDLEIQIIDFQTVGDQIKNNYGFFRKIVKLEDIEKPLIADIVTDTGNPFKVWLKAKAIKMLDDGINQTKYLKKCF